LAGAAKSRSGARRPGATRRGAAGAGQRSHALRWYAAGVLSGVFASFLAWLALLPQEAVDSAGGEPPAAAAPTAGPRPRFEFFEVLPQQTIEVEVDPAQLPQSGSAPEGAVYLLQAGSFRQAEDADRRRAELLLLGLEPRVEETSGSNGRWFRVLLGPFESRSRMAAARSLTAQQNIDTLLVKRSSNP
jgi:cell division protein FtsN